MDNRVIPIFMKNVSYIFLKAGWQIHVTRLLNQVTSINDNSFFLNLCMLKLSYWFQTQQWFLKSEGVWVILGWVRVKGALLGKNTLQGLEMGKSLSKNTKKNGTSDSTHDPIPKTI